MLQKYQSEKERLRFENFGRLSRKILEVDFNGMLLNFNGKEFGRL